MKMYQTVFGDGFRMVEIGQKAYHKRVLDAVFEGFYLMERASQFYDGQISWDNDAPLNGTQTNLQIATGHMAGAKQPFTIIVRTCIS